MCELMAHQKHVPVVRDFNPYSNNGGTILAVAGDDFSIVACDTRLSEGYSILCRTQPKTKILGPKTVIASCGFHGDVLTLWKTLDARLMMYENDHNKKMSTSAVAAMLSTILYNRRFFPYYVYNIICGLDEEDHGAVYSFDPVGSYEREIYRAGGSASSMLQPLLDNQIGYKNQTGVPKVPLTRQRAATLIRDVFVAATERDIYTGDQLLIQVVDKSGIKGEYIELRKD